MTMARASAMILAAIVGMVLAEGMEAKASGHNAALSRFAQTTPPPDTTKPVRVRVTAACEEGSAVFQVFNEGEAWPQPGKIAIYRTDGRALVSQRNLRMTSGQRASFKVKSAGENVEFGLAVEPSWYARPPAYDAKISCK